MNSVDLINNREGSLRWLGLVRPWLVLVLVWGTMPVTAWGDGGQPDEAGEREHLVLLHVNDTHGRLLPHRVKDQNVGGIARLAALVKHIRKENPGRVLLLHGGDAFSDGDSITQRFKGRGNVALMNRVGFDAMVAGNGDYYFGLENLKSRIAEARFPILAGNIFQKTDKGLKAVGKEFTIKKIGPLRMGVLGLSMIRQRHPSSRDLERGNSLELANKWLEELKGQTDLVVVLSHLGVYEDSLLAGTLGGVHIIVGGHTHTALKKPVVTKRQGREPERVYVVQAGKYYENLGRVDLEFERSDEEGWELSKVSGKLISLDENVEIDPEIAEHVETYRQAVRENKDLPSVAVEETVAAEAEPGEAQPEQPAESGAQTVWP